MPINKDTDIGLLVNAVMQTLNQTGEATLDIHCSSTPSRQGEGEYNVTRTYYFDKRAPVIDTCILDKEDDLSNLGLLTEASNYFITKLTELKGKYVLSRMDGNKLKIRVPKKMYIAFYEKARHLYVDTTDNTVGTKRQLLKEFGKFGDKGAQSVDEYVPGKVHSLFRQMYDYAQREVTKLPE